MSATEIKKELKAIANPAKAQLLQGYFKTHKGEYAEGDKFIGIAVPLQRKIAQKYHNINLDEVKKLLLSNIHEFRFTGLVILTLKYKKAFGKDKSRIVTFYLKNKKQINNWDLVDTSAPYILGDWLFSKDRSILFKLAKSKNIWDRRIAILSAFAFIKNNDFKDAMRLAKMFLSDSQDLIHKAAGWMLREVGKRSEQTLKKFLDQNCKTMPRTMLRYAIERFTKVEREKYLSV